MIGKHTHRIQPPALRIVWHDGYWEVRRGWHVVEQCVTLDDALVYLDAPVAQKAA